MLQLTYNDTTYPFDQTFVLVPEARYIKARTGCNVLDFWRAVSDLDADAMLTLWVLASERAGKPLDFDEAAATFNILGLSVTDDEDDEEEDEDLPTSPGAEPGEPTPTTSTT